MVDKFISFCCLLLLFKLSISWDVGGWDEDGLILRSKVLDRPNVFKLVWLIAAAVADDVVVFSSKLDDCILGVRSKRLCVLFEDDGFGGGGGSNGGEGNCCWFCDAFEGDKCCGDILSLEIALLFENCLGLSDREKEEPGEATVVNGLFSVTKLISKSFELDEIRLSGLGSWQLLWFKLLLYFRYLIKMREKIRK